MPWIVGIDEAGYGPNLGPFVMSAVSCRVPAALVDGDLWKVLRPAVRRRNHVADHRLLIEDSKFVYAPALGLEALELGVLATILNCQALGSDVLHHVLANLCPDSLDHLQREPWYQGTKRLPVSATVELLATAGDRFRTVSADKNVTWGPVACVVICPSRFNELLDRWHSKGAILAQALGELLARMKALGDPDESLSIWVDKHGGRNTYAPMVQDAIGEGMVVAHEENAQRSRYSVLGLFRQIRFSFEPRADASHFCVALASMVSKYVRELLMLEFNGFWVTHVPGVKPTAGYPGDSRRFYKEIGPAVANLKIPKAAIWRRK